MSKPEKIIIEIYDYHKCRDWLQSEFGYDERNYANHRFDGSNDDPPYQDFWHFVIDQAKPCNGSQIQMGSWWKEDAEPWQVEIIDRYLTYFGEGDGEDRYASFWVEW